MEKTELQELSAVDGVYALEAALGTQPGRLERFAAFMAANPSEQAILDWLALNWGTGAAIQVHLEDSGFVTVIPQKDLHHGGFRSRAPEILEYGLSRKTRMQTEPLKKMRPRLFLDSWPMEMEGSLLAGACMLLYRKLALRAKHGPAPGADPDE